MGKSDEHFFAYNCATWIVSFLQNCQLCKLPEVDNRYNICFNHSTSLWVMSNLIFSFIFAYNHTDRRKLCMVTLFWDKGGVPTIIIWPTVITVLRCLLHVYCPYWLDYAYFTFWPRAIVSAACAVLRSILVLYRCARHSITDWCHRCLALGHLALSPHHWHVVPTNGTEWLHSHY